MTEIVAHRINTVEGLKKLDPKYGVELDIRESGSILILNHNPLEAGDKPNNYDTLEDYLKEYHDGGHKGLAIFNIKEAGIEGRVMEMAKKYAVNRFFLLDVENPYMYSATGKGIRDIAVRYSESEPIEATMYYKDKLDWVWIDTQTELPLTPGVVEKLKGIKTALVCPDRWGRPQDIPVYAKKMRELGFVPDVVMTSVARIPDWERELAA
ncbi:MAG TPA: hypothetical protein VG965_02815 [Patescibacteria group bacterium]|nr:hypothetical protein [Patescibacteria group bacterium]